MQFRTPAGVAGTELDHGNLGDMTAAAPEGSVAPVLWHAEHPRAPVAMSRCRAGSPRARDVSSWRAPSPAPRAASSLRASTAQMLRAMCPAANETGVVDVLRDMHPDSILLGVLLAARLVSACDRIVQLTPLHGSELSANVLVCIVLAEKLLNDAPFTDLIAMIAAALDSEPRALCQLEFRVLSILSVHEGTIATADELAALQRTVGRTAWRHLDAEECIAMLRVRARVRVRAERARRSAPARLADERRAWRARASPPWRHPPAHAHARA